MIWRYKASRVVVNHDIVKDARFLERRIKTPSVANERDYSRLSGQFRRSHGPETEGLKLSEYPHTFAKRAHLACRIAPPPSTPQGYSPQKQRNRNRVLFRYLIGSNQN